MSVFNAVQYFQLAKNQLFHTQRIMKVKPSVDTSRPKAKLQCTKQPLSQFNRIFLMQLQNKSLANKLKNLETSISKSDKKFKIIKNNRKEYYQEHSIRTQNQGLLRRIRSAKSSYTRKRLDSQRKVNEKYLNFLCKFGYKGRPNSHFKYNSKTLQKQISDLNKSSNQSTLRSSMKQMHTKISTQSKQYIKQETKTQQQKQRKIQSNFSKKQFTDLTNTNKEGTEIKKITFQKKIILKQRPKQNCVDRNSSRKGIKPELSKR